MPNTRTLKLGFTSGEVSPLMFERADLDKMANALATCLNMIVTPQGPVTSRRGLGFAAAGKLIGGASAYLRLIPFNFSQSQNFVVGVYAGCFRWYAQGAALLVGSAAAAYSNTTAYALGALVTDGTLNYYCLQANTGQALSNGAYWYAMPATGEYEIPNPYAQADLQTLHYVQSGDVITIVHPNYPPMELRRYGNLDWQLVTISFASVYSPPPSVSAAATYATSGYAESFTYQVTALDSIGSEESLPSATTGSVSNDLTISGNYNSITWTAATPPSGQTIGAYNVYKAINGGGFGYIGQVPFGTNHFTDNNITPQMTQTPPMSETIFNSAGNYPGAVCYYEQRRFFAGTDDQPQNVWATQSGTQSNMNYSIPSQDSDALRFGIWAKGQNQILHLVQSIDLIAFTASNEFRIYTASGDALTPSTLTIKSQAQNGAADVMPVTVNNFVLYPVYNGSRVRELSFDWTIQGYKTVDVCMLAQHLFDGQVIVDMGFTHAPNPIVWVINAGGQLLGMTYVSDQQVQAWHQHSTGNGDAFEALAVIPENGNDRLYVVVRRTVNGETVRYIEYLDPPLPSPLVEAFFVDCGICQTFSTPTQTVSGLSWLIGESVSILADGFVMADRVVDDTGSITLDFAASVVTVGLPFDAQIATPPAMVQVDADMGASRVKDVNDIWLRVFESGGFWAGPYSGNAAVDDANLVLVNTVNQAPFDPAAPTPLISDVLQLSLYSSLNQSGQVLVQMSDPLPLTVVGVTLEVSVGG